MCHLQAKARKCVECGEWTHSYEDYGGFFVCTSCEEERVEDDAQSYEELVDAAIEAMSRSVSEWE